MEMTLPMAEGGDFFARKRAPSAMWPFSKKRQRRFFETLKGAPPVRPCYTSRMTVSSPRFMA